MNDTTGYSPYQTVSDPDFKRIRDYLHDVAGIDLGPQKKALVTTRLGKRLRHYGLSSYGEYLNLITSGRQPGERQTMLDLLTTNETYFFRESEHFDFMRNEIIPRWKTGSPFRAWSAASSSGEEAYSIAMILAHHFRSAQWEVQGTDISSRVLAAARSGHYSMARTDGIPREYLSKFCMRGTGPHDGTLLINSAIRNRVQFHSANLNETLPELGLFDVIFLRNVLIYFNLETKREIVARVIAKLKPGGYFFIGHSETLHEINNSLERVAPTTYCKAVMQHAVRRSCSYSG